MVDPTSSSDPDGSGPDEHPAEARADAGPDHDAAGEPPAVEPPAAEPPVPGPEVTAAGIPVRGPGRRRIAGVAVAGLVVLGALIVVSGRRSSEVAVDAVDPPPLVETTTSAATSGSDPARTGSGPGATAPSSVSSTIRPTTTTAPRRAGVVTLTEVGVVLHAGTSEQDFVRFGDEAESVVARLVAALGPSTRDTSWRQDSSCEGSESRRVVWGDLEVAFVRGAVGTRSASRTFQQWFVGAPGSRPEGLVTLEGVGIGSTVADLRRVFPALLLTKPSSDGQVGLFVSKPEGEFLEGFTRDTGEAAPITALWAGLACQRIA